jgi:hypothetical protein
MFFNNAVSTARYFNVKHDEKIIVYDELQRKVWNISLKYCPNIYLELLMKITTEIFNIKDHFKWW